MLSRIITRSLCPALLPSGASQVTKSVTAQESHRRVWTRECSAPEFIGRRPHLLDPKRGWEREGKEQYWVQCQQKRLELGGGVWLLLAIADHTQSSD